MRRKDANDVNATGTEQKNVPEAATEQGSGDGPANVVDLQLAANCDGPKVIVTMKNIPEAVAAAEEALTAYNNPPRLFYRDGELVALKPPFGLTQVNPKDLSCELGHAARWFEQTDDKVKPIYPPGLIVHDVLRRALRWAPPLRGVSGIPIFGTGWELLQRPGYHRWDEVVYQPNHAELPCVATEPADDEVTEARRLILEELLGDFPFRTDAGRAAAVAAMILPFIRDRIDGPTPMHAFDSPQPGTGKSLLADMVAFPALGREPAANTEIANGDDLRKWVTAMSMAGELVILIDNINARLSGAALAAALTKVEWSDRIIGTSRLARGSLRPLWLATGNNLEMTAEISRRVVRSRLDARVERPHLRQGFRHADLRSWAKQNRENLISAILTLIRHWVAVGRPQGSAVLGSYETYCRVVGGILHTAEIPGFLADLQSDNRSCDEETAEWATFIAAWWEKFGHRRVKSEDLDADLLAPNPEMLSLTLMTAGSQRGRRIKLGQELRKRRDAVLAGYRIGVSDTMDRHGCWHYHLQPASDPTSKKPSRPATLKAIAAWT
jgi:hypothetical protein